VDGLVARAFHLQSEIGARLDSIADIALQISALAGIVMFRRGFIVQHGLPLLLLVSLYGTETLLALARYRRISSFHTYLCRIAAYAQGIFILTLFFHGFDQRFFQPMIGIGILASLEETIIVGVLPEWTPDVRGLYWVLKRRRTSE
jgi:CDP-diacylglycerol--glycerol-3-phosphate 3-phosphatidyltransferase